METMLAKIRAGVKYDVAFPEAQTAAQLVQAKLLAPLDHAKLTNWGQVNEAFHNPWYDSGAKFRCPTRSGRPASRTARTRSRA